MHKSDKELIKSSSLVLADGIVSMIPGLNIAWGLSKALYGNGIKLRQQRAIEWVEMVRDNPELFTQQLLMNDEFQDGFVYCLEHYLRERNEDKRRYLKRVFIGYASTNSESPLERFIATLQQLDADDMTVLKDAMMKQPGQSYQLYGATDKCVDNIFNLIHLGLLRQEISARWASKAYDAPYVSLTPFGVKFVDFVIR